jgi:magnesium transporter
MERPSIKTNKKVKKRQNNLLSESFSYNGTFDNPTQIRLTVFDKDSLHSSIVKKPGKIDIVSGKVNWIHVSGLKDVESIGELCSVFNLQITVVQDILNSRHIAKIEETDSGIFAILDAYSYDDKMVLSREHQCFILGKDYVLSFEEGLDRSFEQILKSLQENRSQLRKLKADYLFNLLISIVVDSYYEVIEHMQDYLMEMEDQLMEFNADHKDSGKQIQFFRRDYSRLKKAILPFRESFSRLIMLDSEYIISEMKPYFKDTYDHIQQITLMLEANRETLASLIDLYLANNDLRMNHIMKQLTVIATIFIPLTFLAGVWGMNFSFMPELGWQYGYIFAWSVMILVGIGLYIWFRRKNLF